MKSLLFVLLCVFSSSYLFSQNVGVGTNTPTEKLEVNGNVKVQNVIASNVNASGFISAGGTVRRRMVVVLPAPFGPKNP